MFWRDAFFKQAWSDYTVFQAMNGSPYPRCHMLHYLQMTTEKLAKGFLCDFSGEDAPSRKTHIAFSLFLRVSKSKGSFHQLLGYERNSPRYRAYVDTLLPLAERIEHLAPVGGNLNQMNPEYPWVHDDGRVRCPAECDFSDFSRKDIVRMNRFISDLFRVFDFR
ncbi:MAG: hypothetical protein V2B18_25515 [Pseudomonadota bacterium]